MDDETVKGYLNIICLIALSGITLFGLALLARIIKGMWSG